MSFLSYVIFRYFVQKQPKLKFHKESFDRFFLHKIDPLSNKKKIQKIAKILFLIFLMTHKIFFLWIKIKILAVVDLIWVLHSFQYGFNHFTHTLGL